MKVCFLRLHDWRFFKAEQYPEYVRICQKCGRTEELVYNMLDFSWEPNPHRNWVQLREITHKRLGVS